MRSIADLIIVMKLRFSGIDNYRLPEVIVPETWTVSHSCHEQREWSCTYP